MAIITATEDGKKAFLNNRPLIDNPYNNSTPEHIWWIEGWKMEWWNEISKRKTSDSPDY